MHDPIQLEFLGGAGTVTGSRTRVVHEGGTLLVDCGLFQGFKTLRERNWEAPSFDADRLGGLVLTHAHIDHSGYVPLLVKLGYRGPIHATPATADLCRILWADAAHLQEEEAERANRKGYSKHKPAKPLFTVADAERAGAQLRPVPWGRPFDVVGARITFRRAGHILGASGALVEVAGRRVFFSGDVGRPSDPLHGGPDDVPAADVIVCESTYGNRHHEAFDAEEALGEIVRRTVARGGHVIVPAFAVGRTQRLLYHLLRLRRRGAIPEVPVFLNSPLGNKATRVFLDHPEGHTLSEEDAIALSDLPRIVSTPDDSKRLNERKDPCIMIAGSGMATGGRVVHHIRAFASDPRHTLLFTGFQAGGTRGDRILSGETEVKIFGSLVPIRCEVDQLHNLSAHADQDELLAWLRTAPERPSRLVLNHGNPEAADALRARVKDELGWDVTVPLMQDRVSVR